jgi:hypothetical protein
MHVPQFLHNLLAPVMHLKRLVTLELLVSAVLKEKKLSVTQLGRSIANHTSEKNNIKRSDRFLGNPLLHKERPKIYAVMIKRLVGSQNHPRIIVDWSHVPNTTHYILRAALVTKGRALTLYEEVHPKNLEGNPTVHKQFLQQLKEFLPVTCCPIIVTDAGFGNPWFKAVSCLGWDYVGRVRGKKTVLLKDSEKWSSFKEIGQKATTNGEYLGEGTLTTTNPLMTFFYLIKLPKKYRVSLNKLKKKSHYKCDIEYSKSANEPWLLVSSLPNKPALVFTTYTARMTIEEAFRDLKSSQFGYSFEHAYSKKTERIEILLMIAMLAATIAYLVGYIAEENHWQFKFQANSTKNRRILSLFFLGGRIIKKALHIPIHILVAAFTKLPIDLELEHYNL